MEILDDFWQLKYQKTTWILIFLTNFKNSFQGAEQIHVSRFYKEAKEGKFLTHLSEDCQTLYQTFRHGAYESNNGPCLGWRESLSSPYQVSFEAIKIFKF